MPSRGRCVPRPRAGTALLLLVALLLAGAGAATAAVITVRQDGTGDFAAIHDALAAAAPGDVLVIGPGEWRETTYKIDKNLELRAAEGAARTFLDGGQSHRVLQVSLATVVLHGFTIRQGVSSEGSGLLAVDGARVTLEKCEFTGNRATNAGGAVLARQNATRLTMDDCLFQGNTAGSDGGALYLENRAIVLAERCRFLDNKSLQGCGGAKATGVVTLQLRHCVFAGNDGAQAGALDYGDAAGVVLNNTFHANRSGTATVSLRSTQSIIFQRNILAGDQTGRGLDLSGPSITYCNLFHANADAGVPAAAQAHALVEHDPLFCDPGRGDFQLCADSPAVVELPECGVIGALPVGCGSCTPVGTAPMAWGSLKTLYR